MAYFLQLNSPNPYGDLLSPDTFAGLSRQKMKIAIEKLKAISDSLDRQIVIKEKHVEHIKKETEDTSRELIALQLTWKESDRIPSSRVQDADHWRDKAVTAEALIKQHTRERNQMSANAHYIAKTVQKLAKEYTELAEAMKLERKRLQEMETKHTGKKGYLQNHSKRGIGALSFGDLRQWSEEPLQAANHTPVNREEETTTAGTTESDFITLITKYKDKARALMLQNLADKRTETDWMQEIRQKVKAKLQERTHTVDSYLKKHMSKLELMEQYNAPVNTPLPDESIAHVVSETPMMMKRSCELPDGFMRVHVKPKNSFSQTKKEASSTPKKPYSSIDPRNPYLPGKMNTTRKRVRSEAILLAERKSNPRGTISNDGMYKTHRNRGINLPDICTKDGETDKSLKRGSVSSNGDAASRKSVSKLPKLPNKKMPSASDRFQC